VLGRRQGAIAGLAPGLLGVAAAGAAAMTIAPSRGPAPCRASRVDMFYATATRTGSTNRA
jgi:hypothetical protein